MTPPLLSILILPGRFAIHRLPPGASVPRQVLSAPFFAVTRSTEELSLVVSEDVPVKSERSEGGWALLRVAGSMDFSLVGVMAGLTRALADAGISLFAVSTFDTDYLLIKADRIAAARAALSQAGYRVLRPRRPSPAGTLSGKSALEKQLPAIRSLLSERIGPAAVSALKSRTAFALAAGGVYEFLPVALRLVVPRQAFIEFCQANMDRLMPASDESQKKKRKQP